MLFSLKKYWSLILQEFQSVWISRVARFSLQIIKDMIQETLIRLGFIDYIPKKLDSCLVESLTKQQASELLKVELRKHFYFNIEKREEILNALRKVAPEATGAIIVKADLICQHVFDLLGSGPTQLSEKIDWHADFKSGHRWNPRIYYKRIRPAPYPGGYDIKVPWELSRFQHFVRLGQAYWLTGDEKYPREFVAQIKDWIESNPWPFGVNWACTMDVAIRVVNWLWGLAFFLDSPILTDDFFLTLARSLLVHGRHIYRNLENRSGFTNNHYLANLVGLIYLGILCPEFKELAEWRELGLRELWKEMFKQVYPDGASFEGSIAYHRLATELFLSPVILCRLNSIPVPDDVMKRLEKMLEFVMYYTKTDGTVPQIGDADNGRLYRLKIWEPAEREWVDHRYLLAIGAVLFDRQDFAQVADNQWEEVVWLYGQKACIFARHIRYRNLPQLELNSKAFPFCGFYIMRGNNFYLIVNSGGQRENGNCLHMHNDALSFELYANDQTLICDAGTFTYTGDYNKRHWFRSTALHNTVLVDEQDQCYCAPQEPFCVDRNLQSKTLVWEVTETGCSLCAEHNGYLKLTSPVVHKRDFFLDTTNRCLRIRERLVGNGRHKVIRNLHFSPLLEVVVITQQVHVHNKIGRLLRVEWTDKAVAQVADYEMSLSYGLFSKSLLLSLINDNYNTTQDGCLEIVIHY